MSKNRKLTWRYHAEDGGSWWAGQPACKSQYFTIDVRHDGKFTCHFGVEGNGWDRLAVAKTLTRAKTFCEERWAKYVEENQGVVNEATERSSGDD